MSMTDEERVVAFKQRIKEGQKVEAGDWMPEAYRALLIKFIERHAMSELMGALPERGWIPRAPTLQRKLAVISKVQDEVGHAQLLLRLVEDLGKPREQVMQDLFDGKAKYHNIFHYPLDTWGEMSVFVWWADSASLITQSAIRRASYAPYSRVMTKICWEEAFHLKHGEDMVLTLAMGTERQRALVQEAINRWWEPIMMFFGPATPAGKDDAIQWGIKSKPNEEMRQEWLSKYVKKIRELGMTIPDPRLRFDEQSGLWEYTEPDMKKLLSVVTGHGPASQQRLGFRHLTYEECEWVRRTLLAEPAAVVA